MSNDVLGLLVEAVAGQTLGQFLDARLFQPLGMVDTGFVVPADKVKRYARALPTDPETGRPQTIDGRAPSPTGSIAAAPARCRPRRTTCASARCCSTAAGWATRRSWEANRSS